MKKPHVLNRAMFSRGGTSAYGRGITSNLVSDEQRQRFNYGGRVGYYTDYKGGPVGLDYNPNPWGNEPFQGIDPSAELTWGDVGRWMDPTVEEREERKRASEASRIIARQDLMDLENPEDYAGPEEIIEKTKVIDKNDRGDVMTDSDWMELLGPTEEQKKRTKGEAQLGIAAGALDVFSRPTTAKKMQAAVPHLTKLGQTATADQKAREKAILQGKVLSKVYTDRATAKGKADIETLKYKADLLESGSPSERFYAEVQSADAVKPSTIKNALWNATEGKVIAEIMPEEKKANDVLADPKNEGKIYIKGQTAYVIKNGGFEIINYEDIFENLKV